MLQLFVEIVSEAAQFFRLLFTPSPLHVHKKRVRFEKYKRIVKEQSDDEKENEWFIACRRRTWANFDKPKGDPDWSKVSDNLLDELDELNGKTLEGQGDMFNFDKVPYWTAVRKLFKKHVVEGAKDDDDVANHILKKLKWYLKESDHDVRLVIPILTPKMLDALAIHISARSKAYEEVRDNIFKSAFKESFKGVTSHFILNFLCF